MAYAVLYSRLPSISALAGDDIAATFHPVANLFHPSSFLRGVPVVVFDGGVYQGFHAGSQFDVAVLSSALTSKG